ncbi:replication-associated protein [Odonata-associated circular virus-4]|uniref:replication-associated protein n=1 Tax=Odonata-associated circular virus-4 TaxID=1592124 RepID=UPI00058613CF|nr:replication-associated protein [Odonata-associated circular virus-4]AJD07507.1 replication-associated protein [Odonata-associated circular virus-4]
MPSTITYIFTINNPTEDDTDKLQLAPGITSIAYQYERGETGTRHIQGAIRFARRTTFNQVKRILPRAHIEAARGTWQQCMDYCTKLETREEGPFLLGKCANEDMAPYQRLEEDIKNGATRDDIENRHFKLYLRHHTAINHILTFHTKPRSNKPTVTVLWGPTGTGKTRAVVKRASNRGDSLYIKERGKWWDGYAGQAICLLDEFYGWLPFGCLLRLLDRYPNRVEYKGGSTQFTSDEIWITSNKEPKDWYKEEYMDALFRRLDRIVFCDTNVWLLRKIKEQNRPKPYTLNTRQNRLAVRNLT